MIRTLRSNEQSHTAALRRVSASGFRGTQAVKLFLGGALAGFALLCALVLLLHHLDLVMFRGQVLFGEAAQWQLGLKWLGLALLFVLAQEAILRGYVQYASYDAPLLPRLLARSADVVVCEPPPTTGVVTALACLVKRTPFYYYAADVWSDALVAMGAPKAVSGLMRTFEVYKPDADNAGFLEVRHLDVRYLGRRIRAEQLPT